jgi:AIPR protein
VKHQKDLFEFMLAQVKRTAEKNGQQPPQAFGRWFSEMYFPGVTSVTVIDGSGDGKVDLFVTCQSGKAVRYRILNTKFTEAYDRLSPVAFYDEITRYWEAFRNRDNRASYLKVVREPLRPHFRRLFKLYDEGLADLHFVTDHRKNEKQYASVQNYDVVILHLDDLLHYVAEYMEDAMPETETLRLSGVSNVLTPPRTESAVPTSIVFAKLIDFIEYMEDDPFDLLFARNVRVWRGVGRAEETNRNIQTTFRRAPHEFAYSNNGITVICDSHTHDPGKQELLLTNPRVVNGSQTLHSIREVDHPSRDARVMVRIIEVPSSHGEARPDREQKKEIVRNICLRSNQQNPIRRYDLVANDDFQQELSRYFRDKRVCYERRRGEWKHKAFQLKSVGIERGPDIPWMTQLISAFHYDRPGFGPGMAQAKLKELFEEDSYSLIRRTSPTLAYQLYLLAEIGKTTIKRLAKTQQYIANAKAYIKLTTFACLCKILRQNGVAFGKERLNQAFERERAGDQQAWQRSIKDIIDHILGQFKRAAAAVSKNEGAELTLPNYFKNPRLIDELMAKPVVGHPRSIAARFQTQE